MVALADSLAGDGVAVAASGDGSVIVGYAGLVAGQTEAFIWTPTQGLRSLKDVLVNDYGLPVQDWTLLSANDISEDGTTIVGRGFGPRWHRGLDRRDSRAEHDPVGRLRTGCSFDSNAQGTTTGTGGADGTRTRNFRRAYP